ncbi:MAG: L-2-amino-thiazoline-4-carboxylic acid hydrolase [Lachnospiraceae bacterium]|nr:L-2-amino-thiazoline-4-carboxylic acid hydrolase [Lachnospiraceae bacterium]
MDVNANNETTVKKSREVDQIRKAARQFAMQYFHFCKTLYDAFGREKAKELVQKTVYELAYDRAHQMRERAKKEGRKTETVDDFMAVIDLPFDGWIPQWGENHCPYAQVWRTYFDEYPWFREFALFYCDVIDTTTIEAFTHRLSHRLTQNVINSGSCCMREYFESEKVKGGEYTYGG